MRSRTGQVPSEKIRVVKVTTVTVENVSEGPRTGIPAHEVERELHHQQRSSNIILQQFVNSVRELMLNNTE
jgi:hypothetical protein